MRTLIIGLDGADWQIMKPLISEGQLPALKKLMDNGCYGVLHSTIPPHSPTAWASMITGVNPGKHGIFDFTMIDENHQHVPIELMSKLGAIPIWRILNDNGISTGIINLPILYPPEEIQGYLVCGMVTPQSAEIFTYPDYLSQVIGDPGEHWIIGESFTQGGTSEQMLEEIRYKTKHQVDMALRLLDEFETSFLMVVFDGTDKIQHFFWKYWDSTHPRHDPETTEGLRYAISKYYKDLDAYVGRIIEGFGDGNVFIVSDHGFTTLSQDFFIEQWLLQEGYSQLVSPIKSASDRFLGEVVRGIWRTVARLGPVKNFVKRTKSLRPWFERSKYIRDHKGATVGDSIDWKKTRVSLAGPSCQALRIELNFIEGAEASKDGYIHLVNELKTRLLNLIDPVSQCRVIHSVYHRDEIYTGPRIADAPDLVVIPEQGYAFQQGYPGHIFGPSIQYGMDRSGVHRIYGIFIASGPDINRLNSPIELEMVDIMPTVLYLNNVPIPKYLDGKIKMEIIQDTFQGRNPVENTRSYELLSPRSTGYSLEEEAMIEEHLKKLGYL